MADRYTMWAWTSRWSGVTQPVRIMGGTLRECRMRRLQFERDYPDALTGTYRTGDKPEGLTLQVNARLNPDDPAFDYDDPDPEEGCQGHYDTDDALTSGAGIGEAVTCDGSCNPKGP